MLLLASVIGLAALLYEGRQTQPLVFDLVETQQGFSVMRHEVTIAEWQRCVEARTCSYMPKVPTGAIEATYPVTGIGILDAEEFVAWARSSSGRNFRLPSRDEWYAFSDLKPKTSTSLFTDPRLAWAAAYGSEGKIAPTLKPQGAFGENAQSIADVKGNVWEWTSTCVAERSRDRCPAYYAAGEHEAKVPIFVRDPQLGGCTGGTPPAHLGFRLVLDSGQGRLKSAK
jgi:formylglycine-generating enzyme required for sulfatase activity